MPLTLNSKRMFSLALVTLFLAIAIGLYFAFMQEGGFLRSSFEGSPASPAALKVELERGLEPDEQGLSRVSAVIQTTRGNIRYKFYTKDAPKTVHRIAQLIQNGFYNGLTFHRVVPGFVIQGGDPTGSGAGGSGEKLDAEFNTRKHIPGAVAMARAQELNSADSQFYISLGTHPLLDGNYTVFGQVTEGLEVANQIQAGDRMTSVTLQLP